MNNLQSSMGYSYYDKTIYTKFNFDCLEYIFYNLNVEKRTSFLAHQAIAKTIPENTFGNHCLKEQARATWLVHFSEGISI